MSTAQSDEGASFNVGAVIRNARRAAGISQAELARRLGTSQAHLSKWETGARSPRVSDLNEIARVLHRKLGVTIAPREPKQPKSSGLVAFDEVMGTRRGGGSSRPKAS